MCRILLLSELIISIYILCGKRKNKMRHQGKIKSWDKTKGFGFITPDDGGKDVFFHITNINNSKGLLDLGSLVSYEMPNDASKRQQAVNVEIVDEKATQGIQASSLFSYPMILMTGLIVLVIYNLVQYRGNTIQETLYKSIYVRDYKNSDFTCEGKTQCSEMASCAEALYNQDNCGITEIDEDNDGIPCEEQLCT
jgi:cold shock CspA family protein